VTTACLEGGSEGGTLAMIAFFAAFSTTGFGAASGSCAAVPPQGTGAAEGGVGLTVRGFLVEIALDLERLDEALLLLEDPLRCGR